MGATFTRRALKMSGLNASSVELSPPIRIKPMMTMAIPMASKMKFIRPNAKFLLSIYVSNVKDS